MTATACRSEVGDRKKKSKSEVGGIERNNQFELGVGNY